MLEDNYEESHEIAHSRVMKDFNVMDDDIIDSRQLPIGLISPTSNFKLIWNLMMFALIIFIAIVVPYRIPFEDQISEMWFIIDTSTDSIFLLDMILNFMTAYEDENGLLIVKRSKIAKNYIKSWFPIDFISSIPISLI